MCVSTRPQPSWVFFSHKFLVFPGVAAAFRKHFELSVPLPPNACELVSVETYSW